MQIETKAKHTPGPWDEASYRTTDLDGDFRRDPKSDHFCARCQKDLKAGQRYRVVHLVWGGHNVLHPGDEARYQATAAVNGQHPGELGCFPVGMDCARKIGLEWTHEGYPSAAIAKAEGAQ